jgi:hypothetical protein
MRTADTLWAWITEYPDGSTGMVGVLLPDIGNTPLVSRSEEHIRKMRPAAASHAKATGQRVWLRRWDNFTDVEEIER